MLLSLVHEPATMSLRRMQAQVLPNLHKVSQPLLQKQASRKEGSRREWVRAQWLPIVRDPCGTVEFGKCHTCLEKLVLSARLYYNSFLNHLLDCHK